MTDIFFPRDVPGALRSCDCPARAYPQLNADLSGIGVCVSIGLTAFLMVIIIIWYYLVVFQPEQDPYRIDRTGTRQSTTSSFQKRYFKPNPIDVMILGKIRGTFKFLKNAERHPDYPSRLERAVTKSVINMSDLQLITGFALLASGFINFQCELSPSDWNVLIYLTWYPTLTHLCSLTFLRNYLHNRPSQRLWRALGIFCVVLLLFVALGISGKFSHDVGCLGGDLGTGYSYVSCYAPLPLDTFDGVSVSSMATSMLILGFGFISRACKLYGPSAHFLSGRIRPRFSSFSQRLIRRFHRWGNDRTFWGLTSRFILFRTALVFFASSRVFLDMLQSMTIEVFWLMVHCIWATLHLHEARNEQWFASYRLDKDFCTDLNTERGISEEKQSDKWAFGQVMSVLLLGAPLVAVVEYLYPTPRRLRLKEHPGWLNDSDVKEASKESDQPDLSRHLKKESVVLTRQVTESTSNDGELESSETLAGSDPRRGLLDYLDKDSLSMQRLRAWTIPFYMLLFVGLAGFFVANYSQESADTLFLGDIYLTIVFACILFLMALIYTAFLVLVLELELATPRLSPARQRVLRGLKIFVFLYVLTIVAAFVMNFMLTLTYFPMEVYYVFFMSFPSLYISCGIAHGIWVAKRRKRTY